ncbi:MAG TPA: hypothetical protein VHQ65_14295 [Thermoanaerobaculia bacterium]|nr:hypothetical protein [Thermoanaerobaculia bacterium]
MTRHDHIPLELYFRVASGQTEPAVLAQRLHRHLMACCPECRSSWEALGDQGAVVLRVLGRALADDLAWRQELAGGELSAQATAQEPPEPQVAPPRHAAAFDRATRRLDRETAALRARRIEARRELRMLLRTPRSERPRRVARANTRFRSRAVAELLLEESRRRADGDPAEALSLVELVPTVVGRTPGAEPSDWATALRRRARALRADAWRAAGRLDEAQEELSALRHGPEEDAAAFGAAEAAELDGVEAALRAAQGRFSEAERLLTRAASALREAELPVQLARILVQRGALYRRERRFEQGLADLQAALSLLDPESRPFLFVRAAGHLALVLSQLGRFAEAEVAWASTRRWRQAADDPAWVEEVARNLQEASRRDPRIPDDPAP